MKIEKINSLQDNLGLEVAISIPKEKPIGIVVISHGMSEHKERYFSFMEYLTNYGYIAIIHDHRGHGKSVKAKEDLGYFYTKNSSYIVEDLHQIVQYIKKEYPDLPVTLFSHSMGTLVSRCYIKKYDQEIEKLILCGPPTKNSLVDVGILVARLMCLVKGEHYRSNFLQKLTFGSYNNGEKLENSWVCSDERAVMKYNQDELCGYVFTNNGFLNLYKLMKYAYQEKSFQVNNKDLKILLIAGDKDPVIQNKDKFYDLKKLLNQLGYQNIDTKLYSNRRHELLNGLSKEEVKQDVLNFIGGKYEK